MDYELIINGVLIVTAQVHLIMQDLPPSDFIRQFWTIGLSSFESLYEFADARFEDIPQGVTHIGIPLGNEFHSRWKKLSVDEMISLRVPFKSRPDFDSEMSDFSEPSDDYSIGLFANLDVGKWKGEYTPEEYVDQIVKIFDRIPNVTLLHHLPTNPDFEIIRNILSERLSIVEEVSRFRDMIRRAFDEVGNRLESDHSKNSIVTSFNFPEEVAVYCEQYLQYFIQFLRDLGVEATSKLMHKAGEVLFTVTPVDEREALDKIQEALNIYLGLPANPLVGDRTEIAVLRLESAVQRLQSDLKLAAAEIQAKNATIQAQELTISVQKGLLSGEIIFDSLKDVTPKPKDREELLGGTLAIKKYEGKGFDVDLPVVFRRLKQLFTGKEDPNKNSGS